MSHCAYSDCPGGIFLLAQPAARQEQNPGELPVEPHRPVPSDDAWEQAKQAFSGKIGAPGKKDGVMEAIPGETLELSAEASRLPGPFKRPWQGILPACLCMPVWRQIRTRETRSISDGPGDGADRLHILARRCVHRAQILSMGRKRSGPFLPGNRN